MKAKLLFTLSLLLVAVAGQAQQSAPAAEPARAATPPLPARPQPQASSPAAAPAQSEDLACQALSGRVTDSFDHPLTGATVMLRGKEKGFRTDAFSTNAEGQYLLTSKQPIPHNTVLEVTAAGYTSVALPLANCQPVDVTLEPLPGTRFKSNGRIKKTAATGKIR